MTEIVAIEGHWFWGTSIHLITTDGHALLKLVIDDRYKLQGEIYDLNTHPDRQRQGYASALMMKAEEIAIQRGCIKIVLWVEKGSWQEDWYRRLGYEKYEFLTPPHESTIWLVKYISKKNNYEKDSI